MLNFSKSIPMKRQTAYKDGYVFRKFSFLGELILLDKMFVWLKSLEQFFLPPSISTLYF